MADGPGSEGESEQESRELDAAPAPLPCPKCAYPVLLPAGPGEGRCRSCGLSVRLGRQYPARSQAIDSWASWDSVVAILAAAAIATRPQWWIGIAFVPFVITRAMTAVLATRYRSVRYELERAHATLVERRRNRLLTLAWAPGLAGQFLFPLLFWSGMFGFTLAESIAPAAAIGVVYSTIVTVRGLLRSGRPHLQRVRR